MPTRPRAIPFPLEWTKLITGTPTPLTEDELADLVLHLRQAIVDHVMPAYADWKPGRCVGIHRKPMFSC